MTQRTTMGEAVDAVFARMDERKRGLFAIGALIVFGATGGFFLADARGLPAQVTANTLAIDSLRVADRAHAAKLDRANCILTAMATDGDPVKECGL